MTDILPAIDLRSGKCVRLLQGDYSRQINYGDDPLAQAQEFEAQGARWLHVVDLDGALEGSMRNAEVIERIVKNTSLQVEVGGGIRDSQRIESLLGLGVRQVVIGTRALEDIEWFEGQVKANADRLVFGLDARDGKIATHGWTETGETTVEEMARVVNDWPLASIVYTDIACDGMLTGPNVEAMGWLAENCKVPVTASGGVGQLEDIKALSKLPLGGIIVGRALYEGRFTLAEALAVMK